MLRCHGLLRRACSLAFATALPLSGYAENSNTLWEYQFDGQKDVVEGWTVVDGQIENSAAGLILSPDPKKTLRLQHRFVSELSPSGTYRYLQIEVATDGHPENFISCANSSRGGGTLGIVSEGLTTIDLSAQPSLASSSSAQWVFTGFYRSKDGSPILLKSIKTVTIPTGGVTVELETDSNANSAADQNDEILVRYYSAEKHATVAVEPVLFSSNRSTPPTPITLNNEKQFPLYDNGKDGDAVANDGIYSRRIKVSQLPAELEENSDKAPTNSGEPILGMRTLGASPSTGIAPFGFGEFQKIGHVKDHQNEEGPSAEKNRNEWARLTTGQNLAKGLPVSFFPPPDYGLTTDENDAYDLTDGKLSPRMDDRIWFTKDSVGWRIVQDSEIVMLIDLGKVKPVGQIALRLLGGREQGSLVLPSGIEFLASADGRTYHSIQKMAKLMPAEMELSDFKTTFYVPEEGVAFMYPFLCKVPVNARYIAVRIQPYAGLFIDELSVLEADKSPTIELSKFEEVPFSMEGAISYPRKTPLTITRNIITPNWFILRNYETNLPKNNSITLEITVPEHIELLPVGQFDIRELPKSEGSRHYEISNLLAKKGGNYAQLQGPFYFKTDQVLSENQEIVISTNIEGSQSRQIKVPITSVDVPKVGPLPGLDISIGWISDRDQQQWPDLFQSLRHMGFNFVSSFPRNITDRTQPNVADSLVFLSKARGDGFGVIYEESPFHVMEKEIHRALKAGEISEAEKVEVFNLVDGKPGKWINPLYRGKYFKWEIDRVASYTKQVNPNHVYLDIEWWRECVRESKSDPRVQAAHKASGKTWENFILDCGTEVLTELISAIRSSAQDPNVVIGLYNSHPSAPPIQDFFEWNRIYPSLANIAMPSLYVQGRAEDVSRVISDNYRLLNSRNIIPWLTAGTYGEFHPRMMEPMVLEAILNGSRGFTTYWFGDIDPMDYFYIASALSKLSQHPALIENGRPEPYSAANANLHYTCFSTSEESLVLVGNYSHTADNKVTLAVPNSLKGRKVTTDGATEISVPPGETKLVHFKTSEQ